MDHYWTTGTEFGSRDNIPNTGTDEDTSNFQPSLTENQDLPSSENWQDVLEWLYKKLKDHFSMDDLVMSLQYIIDGGGEDDISSV